MSELAENVLVQIAREAAYAGSRLLQEYGWPWKWVRGIGMLIISTVCW